jgi:hypothetical protein
MLRAPDALVCSCSLVSLDGGKDWLVVSPDGFFDGSKGGWRYVSYRRAGRSSWSTMRRPCKGSTDPV